MPPNSPSPIAGTNTLIMGPAGTGKTWCIPTLADAGLEVFCCFTDPNYTSATRDPRIKWKYIPPATGKWADLRKTAEYINTLTIAGLGKLSLNKLAYTQWLDVIDQMNDFRLQTGQSYGDVGLWDTNRALVIDGLTGLNKMSKNLTVGSNPSISQPEWGVMMDNLERFLETLTTQTWCHFVLIAHIEREIDEVAQMSKIMVSTLGRKLAPIIPPKFNDVILASREGTNFFWNTLRSDVDTRAAYLPIQDKQPADFRPLIRVWKERGGVIAQAAAA